jgi:small-conductance mechanosensitive channel
MPPAPHTSKVFRGVLALLYLLGAWFVYVCYEDQRYPTSWPPLAGALSPVFALLLFACPLLLLGSLWFWRWTTARALLLLLVIIGSAVLFATRVANHQRDSELERNLAYATSLVPRIENYQQTQGHYASSWADLGLTAPPVIQRNRTKVPINYILKTNATYQLEIPYGYCRYLYDPTTRGWEYRD